MRQIVLLLTCIAFIGCGESPLTESPPATLVGNVSSPLDQTAHAERPESVSDESEQPTLSGSTLSRERKALHSTRYHVPGLAHLPRGAGK